MKMFKKIYFIMASLFIWVVACDSDENYEGRLKKDGSITISIDQSPSDFAPINLDIETNSNISGTIQSVSALSKVTVASGDVVFLEVTSFEGDGKSFAFDVKPEYALGMTKVSIIAESVDEVSVEEYRQIYVIGGPQLELDVDKFEIDLSVEATDTISGTLKSDGGVLNTLQYYLTQDGTESLYKEVVLTGDQKSSYDIEEVITFEIGMSSFRIVATDDRGNVATENIDIDVVESPIFEMFSYYGVQLVGTGNRKNEGQAMAVNLRDGEPKEYAGILSDINGLGIDFIVASSSSSSPKVCFFSPTDGWPWGNFDLEENSVSGFEYNETLFSPMSRGVEADFDAATMEDIQAMSLTDGGLDPVTRCRDVVEGDQWPSIWENQEVIYFETVWGAQGIVRIDDYIPEEGKETNYKEHTFVMNFKVVFKTN